MYTIVQKNASSTPRVVIVGAGISGLVVASLLHDVPAEVLVLRQNMVPARARCFPGLFSEGDLRSLKLDVDNLPSLLVREITRRTERSGGDDEDSVPVDLHLIEHGVLLDALEKHVAEHGVQVIDNFTASRLVLSDGVVGGVTDEARNKSINADLVVLADESDPRLAEQVGLRPDWLPTELMHLAKSHYPAANAVIDERFNGGQQGYRVTTIRYTSSWGTQGVGMLTPAANGISVQVAMLLEDEMASAKHISEYLEEFKALPEVKSALDGLCAERFFTEVVPVGGFSGSRRFHTDGMIVTNDLLGVTHPLNRDGLSNNLKACAAAAISIRSAIAGSDFSSGVLSRYSRQLQAEVIRPVESRRRRSRDLRSRPAWERAALPELLGTTEGMTGADFSATLPESARLKASRRIGWLGRRIGWRSGSRDLIDE